MIKWRLYTIFIGIVGLFLLIIARLFYWQIVRGAELSAAASGQHINNQILEAPRGEIFARDRSWLVSRGESWIVTANPKEIESKPSDVAEKIAILSTKVEEEDDYREKLMKEIDRMAALLDKRNLYWVSLLNRVDPELKHKIEDMNIKGIGFEKEEARYYPEGSASAQLLGFLGKDDKGESVGYFGLEGYYDEMLSGKKGYVSRDSDARGVPILFGNFREVKSINGIDLITTIDKYVQLTVEKRLKEGIEKYGAASATAIVANPKNGEIYAMTSLPSFDPSKYWQFGDSYFINPSISQSFEPGSIFKVVVMSAGLDAKVVGPDTKCDICDKPLKIDKYFIKTWNNQYTANATMTDVIVHSDNVGMSFVGKRLGKDRLYDYLHNFGFGETTGVDLQGEASPQLRKKNEWREIDTATASFGQGIAVTPLQMIRAVSAIANGGLLVNPHVVSKFKNESWEYDNEFPEPKKVISEEAARKMTGMMVEAVKNGESKWTYLRGFTVAGKTGTAQIPIEGHYDAEKTIASFIGFAPADNPKFIMLITLREPKSSIWASETAAPLWFSIAKDLFMYYGIQPEN